MTTRMPVELPITAKVSGTEQIDQLTQKMKLLGFTGEMSAKQIKQAYRQLPAQFTDIAVSLAGGQNPFMVLLQQGGQVRDQFGSIGNAAKAMASFLTPTRLALTGVGAAFGTMAYAAFSAQKEFASFQRTMMLTGNYAAMSYGEFIKLSDAISKSSGASAGVTRDLLRGAMATGEFGPGSIKEVAAAMAKYQEISGATADEVVKDFASMAGGAAAWAAQKNKSLNFLTYEQYKYIKALELSGEKEKAMAEAARLMKETLDQRRTDLGYLEEGLKKVAYWAGQAKAALMNWGRDDPAAQLESLQKRLQEVENPQRVAGRPTPPVNQGLAARLREEIALIQARLREDKKLVQRDAEIAAAEKKKINADQSGVTNRLAFGALERANILEQMAADKKLALIKKGEAELKAERDKALISEQEYIRQSTDLKQQALDVEISVAEKRLESIRARPKGDKSFEDDRATDIQRAKAEIDKLRIERDLLGQTGKIEAGTADFKQSRELQQYTQELAHQNEMIRLQGQEVNMTDFAYKQLVATKQHEYDIMVKTRGMSAGEAEAYRQVADEAFRLKQALEQVNYEQSRTFEFGAKKAIKTYLDDIGDAGKATEKAFTAAFKTMEDSLVEFAMTGKMSFGDFANSIIKDLIRMTIQMMVMKPLMGAFGGFMGFKMNADGGVYGAAQAFANGGVVNSPTLFKFAAGGTMRNGIMGEAGPEAIMPLKRTTDGKLGVIAAGGASGDTSVVVNVNVENGGEQVTSNQGASALGKVIAGAVRAELINQKRPGGLLAA